jgi:hypothetical protein
MCKRDAVSFRFITITSTRQVAGPHLDPAAPRPLEVTSTKYKMSYKNYTVKEFHTKLFLIIFPTRAKRLQSGMGNNAFITVISPLPCPKTLFS